MITQRLGFTKDFMMMYCRVGFAHRDRNGGQSQLYLLSGFILDSAVEHEGSIPAADTSFSTILQHSNY